MQNFTTLSREQWLTDAMTALSPMIEEVGGEVPANMRVSVSFAYKSAKALGQALGPKMCAQEKYLHVLIHPALDDTVEVLGVLLHEMLHHVAGLDQKHGGRFKKLALALGMGCGSELNEQGNPVMTKMPYATAVPGSVLHARLTELADQLLGQYPHVAVVNAPKGSPNKRTKNISFYSVNNPEYRVCMPIPTAEEFGRPRDPQGDEMVLKEELEEEGE